ncbi:ribosomal protein L6, alpha-beta domain-containing protein [Coniochaeta sp. 2T2.1]|nr:ribosomal protein L6, alpha-beta domain-containing protein [Coniochaeta sp. 2T2.1]
MFAPCRRSVLEKAAAASQSTTLPSFLVPTLQTRRPFSSTTCRPSKLGRTPISIPPGVELMIGEPKIKKDPTNWRIEPKRTVTVAGPLGELNLEIPPYLKIDHDAAARRAVLSVDNTDEKNQREMWGTTWAYLQKHILGVSEGHTAVLRLVGIGYRATVEARPHLEEYPGQQFVILKLGFSHPVEMGCPKGISASAPQPTRILLEGINREELMSFAARIRRWRVPEPYKGKGIFVNEETIKLKQKKIK